MESLLDKYKSELSEKHINNLEKIIGMIAKLNSTGCTTPPELFMSIVETMEEGVKHGADTWMNKDGPTMSKEINCAKIIKHAANHLQGEIFEPGTDNPHLGRTACRAAMADARRRLGIDE